MMGFVLGFILGAGAGYAGAYLQTHPEKFQELKDLFKRKPKP